MEKRENYSRKRVAVLTALRQTTVHPTAEWLYNTLKPAYPDLSLGTVYRNLKMFCRTGKAVSVGTIRGQEHFDGNVVPHAHFICEECDRVVDVPKEFFGARELNMVSLNIGHEVASAEVIFRGRCRDCRRAAEKAAEAAEAEKAAGVS